MACVNFAVWRLLDGRQLQCKNVKTTCFSERVMGLCMCENYILVLPVNILTMWPPWLHDTIPSVLIRYIYEDSQKFYCINWHS